MKKRLLPILFLIVGVVQFSAAQTGPAGVGTNTASTSQVRFWVKADVGVFTDAGVTSAVNGNAVQQWNDQSGVANHATQTTAPSRKPVYATNAVNGLPALRFDGGDYLTAGAFPSIANNVGYTYLVVFKDTSFTAGTQSDGAGDYIIDRGLPGAEVNELCSFKVTSTNKVGFQKRDGGGGGLGGPVSATTLTTTAYHIADYRQTPGATKVYDLFYDGILEGTASSADANYVPPVPQIGHHYQPANGGMKGYIAEVILYNYNCNLAQINILNSYLGAKYGLSPANDKYAGDAAGTDYDFEVAGVGKESSGSNTSASSSVSGGLDVTQGSVAMENGEYCVFGHQAGANTLNWTDIGGMSAGSWVTRWNRIWFLDFTHSGASTTNENYDLTFDVSDGGMGIATAATASNYKLLYRNSTSGSWTESSITPTLSGDKITFSGVDYNTFGDGYYTIGTLNNSASPLPIELLNFNAVQCDKNVCLDWSTASETNNDYFTVERSKDGISFEIACIVDGSANSTQKVSYSSLDRTAYSGISYYRLKQTDFHGDASYSAIRTVDLSENGFAVDVYPNPSDGSDIQMKISGTRGEGVLVVVYDASGREAYSKVLVTDDTETVYAIDPSGKLSPGIYMITATSNDKLINKKLIVN